MKATEQNFDAILFKLYKVVLLSSFISLEGKLDNKDTSHLYKIVMISIVAKFCIHDQFPGFFKVNFSLSSCLVSVNQTKACSKRRATAVPNSNEGAISIQARQ